MEERLTGTFRTGDGIPVPGTAILHGDGTYTLDLEQFCFMPRQITPLPSGYSISADARHIVADHEPRCILAEFDGQRLMSFPEAHMQDVLGLPARVTQQMKGQRYLDGAHLSFASPVEGIRWVWDLAAPGLRPDQNDLWTEREPTRVRLPISGTLRRIVEGNDCGMEYTPDDSVPLYDLISGVQGPSTVLAGLWCRRRPPAIIRTWVLASGTFHEYVAPAEPVGRIPKSDLLPVQNLTGHKIATWLEMAHGLEPLPYIAAVQLDLMPLQATAQVLTTALEGLHKRLSPPSRRRVDYAVRVEDLAKELEEVAPGLCGPPDLERWKKTVKDIRNDQSHQSLTRFHGAEADRYYAASLAVRNVLALRMLLLLVPADALRDALAGSRSVQCDLANMDQAGLYPGFSALDTFRLATAVDTAQAETR